MVSNSVVNSSFRGVLYEEGGIAGNMSHPYDILSPIELIDFFENIFSGSIEVGEKVDGVNLFVGYDDKMQLNFARTQTEEISNDISTKFSITHPAHDVFHAGFSAIVKGIDALSIGDKLKYNLIEKTPSGYVGKYWLNLEILYGEVPNIIVYSDVTNYVVFHNYRENNRSTNNKYGPVEVDDANTLLKNLAKTIDTVTVTAPVVTLVGYDYGQIMRQVSKAKSIWSFNGPIVITKDKIAKNLETIAKKWKSKPEVKALYDGIENKVDDSTMKILMQAATTSIGSDILSNVTSELYNSKTMVDTFHPKIEGLVVSDYKGNTIKITGDFRELNKALWQDLDKVNTVIEKLYKLVINDILAIPKIKSISAITWDKANGNAAEFIKLKATKSKWQEKGVWDDSKINAKLENGDILTIKKTISDITNDIGVIKQDLMTLNNIKKPEIEKAIKLVLLKLYQFDMAINSDIANLTYPTLLNDFAKIFFNR